MRLYTHVFFLFSILSTALALWDSKDPCPTSIEAKIDADPSRSLDDRYPYDVTPFTTWDSVHSALLTCPNISTLDISVYGSCSTWPDRMNLPLSPFGGEKYPDIKSLKVEGYQWETLQHHEIWKGPKCLAPGKLECFMDTLYWVYKGHWISWLGWRTQSKEQCEKTNAELWLDAMNWTRIEELSVDTVPESVRKVLSRSQALRSLNTTDGELILNLPKNTLKHLSLVNGERDTVLFEDVLNQQGRSLESLELRWDTEHYPGRYDGDLDDEIQMIRKSAKKIRHLSINVFRNASSSPLETLGKIVSISTLREADFWIDILGPREWSYKELRALGEQYAEAEGGRYLFLNKKDALNIFNYMRDKKQGQELERATFWIGDWTRNWLWETPRAHVECEAKADVDMEDWCVVDDQWPHYPMFVLTPRVEALEIMDTDFRCGTT
ncbi:hypothetical protein J4E93_008956 [Alternaria ventricosa]|uniref:uncharacterized protein n=1 Tax=Alternaria ventricosa TaxID=1187951 RepID=UPI0020C571CC|nr:uncharacterized protein J4E93_008956 [Alternaria ventricosa]KAI4639604.1 hypothetical protein J4E93_008956 [Alternaria ventricosa]